jgi:hypothetical protein
MHLVESQLQSTANESALRAELQSLMRTPDLRHDYKACERIREILLGLRFIRLTQRAVTDR